MLSTASDISTGASWRVASGKSGKPSFMKPYVPIFSMTPARITEPAVGASTWASGSHVCSGAIGTLIAKLSANAASRIVWTSSGRCVCTRSANANEVIPVVFCSDQTR
jgi:hypothetical protein